MTIATTNLPTDLALPQVTGGDLPGLAVLQQWADANDTATRLVAPWVWTDLVPLHHWPNPAGMTLKTWPNPRLSPPNESDQEYRRRAEIATASAAGTVLRGMALGLSPNIALEQMHSIHGRIGMMTKMKYALALSRGKKAWDVKLSEEEVICAGILEATGETIEIGITMAQARKAGWTSNDVYAKMPIDILWARAMSRVLDRIAGDVLFGLASVEDLRDLPDPGEQAPIVTRTSTQDIQARAAAAAGAGAVQSTPVTATEAQEIPTEQAEQAAPADPPAETGEAITMAQSRKVAGLMRQLDLDPAKEPDAARHVLSFIAERDVDGWKHLTTTEADRVIARLGELAGKPEAKWRAEIRFILTGADEAGQLPMPEDGARG